ncbi:AfsR/SARP family transcriptional regulator [Herbidospora daliensis]|uniref:AfsR/SARP family transcriptional regulator n=1 Tax=Herbidospora daliensis TaxID=295585 RepID=UPI0007847E69|nr:AfsR/SARP family transcriptional regulator [Herbidospora daliensis]
MEFRVLGPISVIGADGAALDIGPLQQRSVLALCLLASPRPVTVTRIIDALWDEDPPVSAVNTVQAYISKLRRVLEPGRSRRGAAAVLVGRAGGYALDIPDGDVDLRRVNGRVDEGRRLLAAGDAAKAAREFRLALSEWRGDALTGFENLPWAREERVALDELRLTVVEEANEADLALGRGSELVPGLVRLVAAYPTRERVRRHAAHALYQAGRQADALALLAEGRRLLIDELGLDPEPRTRELEARILAQDAALSPTIAVRVAAPPPAAEILGRSAELARLAAAVEAPGHRIVLVAGEPGIGKTSLVEAAAHQATSATGARAVVGRCWDGGGAPPFWPWVTALRELTGRDGELAEITAATGEFPMYEAVARLVNAAGPAVVVLDDLQWADAASLRLLDFLATTRSCPGLTVLATYRDTEVGEPLARALAALRRLPHVEGVTLGGLPEDAVAEYLARSGGDPLRAGVELRRTGGNPFFLGLGDSPGAMAEVLRGRLAALPPGAHDVLSAAALIGRETELGVLLDVLDLPQDQVLDVLDAAVQARLLTERQFFPETTRLGYTFSHDIVRDVLRDGLAPLRRRRMHARVAAVLEARGTQPGELAYHYREGLVISGLAAKAVTYARAAARHAAGQFAHEDAAVHLEHAVALTGQLPVTDLALRCDLLIELAEALTVAGLNSRVHPVLDEAVAVADELGDGERLARAALGFSDPLVWAMYEELNATAVLVERIDRALAGAGARWRSMLLSASAIIGAFTRPMDDSRALAAQAIEEAPDDRSLLRALSAAELLSRGVAPVEERAVLLDRMRGVGVDLVDEWLVQEAWYVELFTQGRFDEGRPILDWLRRTAADLRRPALVGLAAWQAAIRAYMLGDLALAEAEAAEAARAHPEGGRGPKSRADLMRALRLRAEGDSAGALKIEHEEQMWTILRCALLLDVGREEESRELFAALSRDGFAVLVGDLAYRIVPDMLTELIVAFDDREAARALYPHLEVCAGRVLGWAVADRCLARLADVLGRDSAALRRSADEFARRAGMPH